MIENILRITKPENANTSRIVQTNQHPDSLCANQARLSPRKSPKNILIFRTPRVKSKFIPHGESPPSRFNTPSAREPCQRNHQPHASCIRRSLNVSLTSPRHMLHNKHPRLSRVTNSSLVANHSKFMQTKTIEDRARQNGNTYLALRVAPHRR